MDEDIPVVVVGQEDHHDTHPTEALGVPVPDVGVNDIRSSGVVGPSPDGLSQPSSTSDDATSHAESSSLPLTPRSDVPSEGAVQVIKGSVEDVGAEALPADRLVEPEGPDEEDEPQDKVVPLPKPLPRDTPAGRLSFLESVSSSHGSFSESLRRRTNTVTTLQRESAATRIQAQARGYLTRRHLRDLLMRVFRIWDFSVVGRPFVGETLTAVGRPIKASTPLADVERELAAREMGTGERVLCRFAWSRVPDRPGARAIPIRGATSHSYTPTSEDIGFRLRVGCIPYSSEKERGITSSAETVPISPDPDMISTLAYLQRKNVRKVVFGRIFPVNEEKGTVWTVAFTSTHIKIKQKHKTRFKVDFNKETRAEPVPGDSRKLVLRLDKVLGFPILTDHGRTRDLLTMVVMQFRDTALQLPVLWAIDARRQNALRKKELQAAFHQKEKTVFTGYKSSSVFTAKGKVTSGEIPYRTVESIAAACLQALVRGFLARREAARRRALPRIYELSIFGEGLMCHILTAAGRCAYPCEYQWYRKREESGWIAIPGANGHTFYPTADDVGCILRVICFPHQDGRRGIPMHAQTHRVEPDADLLSKYSSFVKRDHTWKVKSTEGGGETWSVTLKKDRIKIMEGKTMKYSVDYNASTRVILDPADPSTFLLRLNDDISMTIHLEPNWERDILALVLRHLRDSHLSRKGF
eukprot:TRINITY_DN35468_c0_g1_i1.p1 TRINITY_DN35468_c0_g1~~TRINITY_DN35468_c0_g1_i1.p1  ORF type:complete len:718 (-),score=144.45 TRINITY_DN35468_c0_g1_i1:44-2131(-)